MTLVSSVVTWHCHYFHSIIHAHMSLHWVYCCVCSPSSTNTEPSLNLPNLNTALEGLPHGEWYGFSDWLNVPRSQQNEIEAEYSTDGQRMSALLHTYLTSHPAPSWLHVASALYSYKGGRFHAVLERVQSMFPTGKKMHRRYHLLGHIQYVSDFIFVILRLKFHLRMYIILTNLCLSGNYSMCSLEYTVCVHTHHPLCSNPYMHVGSCHSAYTCNLSSYSVHVFSQVCICISTYRCISLFYTCESCP